MTKEEKLRDVFLTRKEHGSADIPYRQEDLEAIYVAMEEYAQQSKPETIKTVNPSAYWFNGRLVSFEDMKSRTVSDMDEIVPLYTMQLRKPKP